MELRTARPLSFGGFAPMEARQETISPRRAARQPLDARRGQTFLVKSMGDSGRATGVRAAAGTHSSAEAARVSVRAAAAVLPFGCGAHDHLRAAFAASRPGARLRAEPRRSPGRPASCSQSSLASRSCTVSKRVRACEHGLGRLVLQRPIPVCSRRSGMSADEPQPARRGTRCGGT